MLITISTPNLGTEYKQLIEATYEQSTSTHVVFVGDGVYAPALNSAFFEQLANSAANTVKSTVASPVESTTKNSVEDKPTLNLSFLSTDAATRGANLPEHVNPISHKELAAISAKYQHWIPLS
ncbi:DsrH/TusB family sulfur relay protein [Alteromonas sp. ALT199]|uniref:DsrH/TusB family sulfur relay protein n=1 Tax=unclassified Alteromonas TaxID=2614992 RepID=UPI001BEACDFF|nr:DsrH/TusB family sulfur relay protein [Alteromonas sp. ALT199]MBT3135798.1 DsrH/TusB family sulfur relay protein [Alteromonas sp. ALT199]